MLLIKRHAPNPSNGQSRGDPHRWMSEVEQKPYLQTHSVEKIVKLCKLFDPMDGLTALSFKLVITSLNRLDSYDFEGNSVSQQLNARIPDEHDWNLELARNSMFFFHFMTTNNAVSVERVLRMVWWLETERGESKLFQVMIGGTLDILQRCVRDIGTVQCSDQWERSKYPLQCVWEITGYLIEIVTEMYKHRHFYAFQQWDIDSKLLQHIEVVLQIYNVFIFPIGELWSGGKATITQLDRHELVLYRQSTELLLGIVESAGKEDVERQSVERMLLLEDAVQYFNFIVDPLVFGLELLEFLRSEVRPEDEETVGRIMVNSMRILRLTMRYLTAQQIQEIVNRVNERLLYHSHSSTSSQGQERMSMMDKLCQIMQQPKRSTANDIVIECTKMLRFLCDTFPATSVTPYYLLISSMTCIERMGQWMVTQLDPTQWMLPESDSQGSSPSPLGIDDGESIRKLAKRRAESLVDLLCVFMEHKNRLRNMLLRTDPQANPLENPLVNVLLEIIKSRDAHTHHTHLTACSLHILWLLHSDLEPAVMPLIAGSNNTTPLWDEVEKCLQSDWDEVPSSREVERSTGEAVSSTYVTRCWQHESWCWCFQLMVQEMEQTVNHFDSINTQYKARIRRDKVNELITKFMVLPQFRKVPLLEMVQVPVLSADLLRKQQYVSNLLDIKFDEFLTAIPDLGIYGASFHYDLEAMALRLDALSRSAENGRWRRNTRAFPPRRGRKRTYREISVDDNDDADLLIELMYHFNLQNDQQNNSNNMNRKDWRKSMQNVIRTALSTVRQFNLRQSLIASHDKMRDGWTDLMTTVCLCSPHIVGLPPITCYNRKLSPNHFAMAIQKIKERTAQSATKGSLGKMIFSSPTKRQINQEESIKQLLHWNALRAMPQPSAAQASKVITDFIMELTATMKNAFMEMMDPYFERKEEEKKDEEEEEEDGNEHEKAPIETLENISDPLLLNQHLVRYLALCEALSDLVNHSTQSVAEEDNAAAATLTRLTFENSKTVFMDIAECIKMASHFAATRMQSPSVKKQRLDHQGDCDLNEQQRLDSVDAIVEKLLMICMMLMKWMETKGPVVEVNVAAVDLNASFVPTSATKKRSTFTEWRRRNPADNSIRRVLDFGGDDYKDPDDDGDDDPHDSDDDVIHLDGGIHFPPNLDANHNHNRNPDGNDPNFSSLNPDAHNLSMLSTASQGLREHDHWFPAIRGSLMILKALSSTSRHLLVQTKADTLSSVTAVFPYLIECIPYPELALEAVQSNKLIEFMMDHFASISNGVVDAFADKERELNRMGREHDMISQKPFQTKSDQKRIEELKSERLLKTEQFMANQFKPSIEALSGILQCFEAVAQKSLDGALSLYSCDLMLYLTNCAIFKSALGQFVDPYLVDSGEENPCHELWCKTLELVTYLLRQTALALKTMRQISGIADNDAEKERRTKRLNLMSAFVRNVMQFCTVHHERIWRKILKVGDPESDLRLRDLEEVRSISSFLYEIQKNKLLIQQQFLENKHHFKVHDERVSAMLHCMTKRVTLLEKPEMLSQRTPLVSTYEKYAFGYRAVTRGPSVAAAIGDSGNQAAASQDGSGSASSRHIQWADDVVGGNTTTSLQAPSAGGDGTGSQNGPSSPLPAGRLTRSVSTDTIADDVGGEEEAVRRDQFLKRIEFYILDILKNALFCCRIKIFYHFKYQKEAVYLFDPQLVSTQFLSGEDLIAPMQRPNLSVLISLCDYCITHLKSLYKSSVVDGGGSDGGTGALGGQQPAGLLRRGNHQRVPSSGSSTLDSFYSSWKLETESEYGVVTWTNIEKTLWISLQHSYMTLLLQIELYMRSDADIVGKRVIEYQTRISKLYDRISRLHTFLKDRRLISDRSGSVGTSEVATEEMMFVTMLQKKQHQTIKDEIELLNKRINPEVTVPPRQPLLGDQSMMHSDTMTDITGRTRIGTGYLSGASSMYPSAFNTPVSRSMF